MRIIVERDGKEVEVILAHPINTGDKTWCGYLNIGGERVKYIRTIRNENN